MLYTVNRSPFKTRTLESAIAYGSVSDKILLIEDGVYAAIKSDLTDEIISKANLSKIKIFALSEDLKARGISEIRDDVTVVDYSGFVDLVVDDKVVAWV